MSLGLGSQAIFDRALNSLRDIAIERRNILCFNFGMIDERVCGRELL